MFEGREFEPPCYLIKRLYRFGITCDPSKSIWPQGDGYVEYNYY